MPVHSSDDDDGGAPNFDIEGFDGPRYVMFETAKSVMLEDILREMNFIGAFPQEFAKRHKQLLLDTERRLKHLIRSGIVAEVDKVNAEKQMKKKLNFLDLHVQIDSEHRVYMSDAEDRAERLQWVQDNKESMHSLKREMVSLLSILRQANASRERHIEKLQDDLRKAGQFIDESSQKLDRLIEIADKNWLSRAEEDIHLLEFDSADSNSGGSGSSRSCGSSGSSSSSRGQGGGGSSSSSSSSRGRRDRRKGDDDMETEE